MSPASNSKTDAVPATPARTSPETPAATTATTHTSDPDPATLDNAVTAVKVDESVVDDSMTDIAAAAAEEGGSITGGVPGVTGTHGTGVKAAEPPDKTGAAGLCEVEAASPATTDAMADVESSIFTALNSSDNLSTVA